MNNLFHAVQPARSWHHILLPEFEKAYFKRLEEFIQSEQDKGKVIYPATINIFRALELCPIWNTRVVIIGQDPYHRPRQANGMAFSVNNHEPLPPSLKNIHRALRADLGINNKTGDLTYWAAQGVLLLNTVLTVERGKPASHANKGWEKLTDTLISNVDALATPVVFLLWGKHAQQKRKLIEGTHHLILEAPHPSPLSAHLGFFWCKHFSKTNEFLKKNKLEPIDWRLP